MKNNIYYIDFDAEKLSPHKKPARSHTSPTFNESVSFSNETDYREIFEKSHTVQLLIDSTTGNIYDSNPAACLFYGFTREQFKDKNIADFVILTTEEISKNLKKALTENCNRFPVKHRIASGKICDVEMDCSPVMIKKRELIYSIVHDVSERKIFEATLQESEERLRQLFDNANDIIYTHDLNGNYTSINQAAERIFGYSVEEILTMNMAQVLTVQDLEISRQKLAEKIKGQTHSSYEITCVAKGGRLITLEVNSCVVCKDGVAVGVQGIARDITERKSVEENLRESELKFRTVAETASDAVITIDEKGIMLFVNNAAEKIFGYKMNEMVGENLDMLMPKRLRKAHQRGVLQYIVAEKSTASSKSVEIVGLHKNGHEVPLELSFARYKKNDSHFFTGIIRDITERKFAEMALKDSEARFRDLFENANDLIYTHDLRGNFTSLNRTGELLTGYSREETMTMNISQVVAPHSLKKARKMIGEKVEDDSLTSYELDIIAKDGKKLTLELNTRLIFQGEKPIGIQGIGRDITQRKQTEKSLLKTVSVLASTLESTADGIVVADSNRKIVTFNEKFVEMFKVPASILDSNKIDEIAKFIQTQLIYSENFMNSIEYLYTNPEATLFDTLEFIDGRVFERYSKPQILQGKPVGRVVSFRDITKRTEAEKRLRHSALFDSLTDLPNRAQFMNELGISVERSKTNTDFGFAVLFLDFDRFKVINDGLGHAIGDKLIIAISRRLKSCVRPEDVVARLGGDEFTILLNDIKDKDTIIRIVKRLNKKLLAPFQLDNYEVFTSASIGVVIEDEFILRNPEDFVRDADMAMYQAKEAGKARYEVFDSEMHVRNLTFLQVETDLRYAIEREELRVHYQPIISLDTGEIREFEALIRWEHPQLGLVPPDKFINIAEETGLIIPIGKWILEEACRQTVQWQKAFPSPFPIAISVNLSAKQLMHPSLTAQVKEVLAKTNLHANCLKLEVTETMVMEHYDTAHRVLSELHDLGVKLSTDDFGTGYSSLSYLHRFPFDLLKIDRSFISKMDTETKSAAIVRTIVRLGQNLGIEITAEGIETDRQLQQLRTLGCQFGQGYLFSKPVTADEAFKLIKGGIENFIPLSLNDSTFVLHKTIKQRFFEIDEIQ